MKKDNMRRLGVILGGFLSFCAVCLVLGLLFVKMGLNLLGVIDF